MNRARLMASGYLTALLLCAALPVSAQVVIGGDHGDSSVDVDWSVLEKLGPSPTLADMLKKPAPARSPSELRAHRLATQAEESVVFRKLNPPKLHFKPAPAPQVQAQTTVVAKPLAAKPQPAMAAASPAPVPVKVGHPQPVKKAQAEPPALPPIVQPLPAKPALANPPPIAIPAPVPAPVVAQAKPVAAPPPPAPKPVPPPPAAAAPASAAPPAPAAIAAAPMPMPPALSALTPPPPPPQLAVVTPPPEPTPVRAAAPSDSVIAKPDLLTIIFPVDSSQLPAAAQNALTQLAQRMSRDDSMTLQLLAYADGDATNVSKARRMSLSRALEVRRVLMDLGVRSTRIEVRALGNKQEGNGPIDRVDALITSH